MAQEYVLKVPIRSEYTSSLTLPDAFLKAATDEWGLIMKEGSGGREKPGKGA